MKNYFSSEFNAKYAWEAGLRAYRHKPASQASRIKFRLNDMRNILIINNNLYLSNLNSSCFNFEKNNSPTTFP